MTVHASLLAILGLAVGLGLLACASHVLPAPPDPDPLDREAYVIGPDDRLRISVWKNPGLSVDVPVRPDGKISVPLLDDVQAAGLTAEELKQVLTEALAEYVAAPDVTVIVGQVNSKRVYILGDGITRKAAIPLTQDLRVLEVIAIAGGFGPFADRGAVQILRRTQSGDVVEYRFDYDAFVKGKAPGTNLLLQPGDTIVVPD